MKLIEQDAIKIFERILVELADSTQLARATAGADPPRFDLIAPSRCIDRIMASHRVTLPRPIEGAAADDFGMIADGAVDITATCSSHDGAVTLQDFNNRQRFEGYSND